MKKLALAIACVAAMLAAIVLVALAIGAAPEPATQCLEREPAGPPVYVKIGSVMVPVESEGRCRRSVTRVAR